MCDTPNARPNSAPFQIWPCQCASIAQKRRRVAGGIVLPSSGRSRAMSVRTNPSRQRRLAGSDRARYERGKPPRNQRPLRVVHLGHAEPVQFVERDPPRERLRRLAK